MNKKKYILRMTPYEKLQSTVLIIIALLLFILVMWFGGCVIGSQGNSFTILPGDNKPMIIVSESMTPTIEVNGIVIIGKKDFKDIKVGDIILFKTDRYGLICHRVIRDGNQIFTKGDHNQTVDYWTVTEDMYKGYVVDIHNEYSGLITFLFGDLNNINLARLLFGFLMLTFFFIVFILICIWVYQYFCIFFFIRKSSKIGGRLVVNEYYSFVEDDMIKNKLIELYDSFGKKSKFRKTLIMRLELLRLHKSVVKYEKQRKRSIAIYEQFRGDIEKYGL